MPDCTDPLINDECTVFLLRSDHANHSQIFTDIGEGPNCPHPITLHGNVEHSTDQHKFGASSIYFPGTGHWLDIPDHTDWNTSTEDFTIDFWMMRALLHDRQFMLGQINAAGTAQNLSFRIELTTADKLTFTVAQGGLLRNAISTASILDTDTWHHIAAVRYDGLLRIFIDGALDGVGCILSGIVNDSPNLFAIGRQGEWNGLYYNGYIDELRFSKDIARWIDDFTPPTTTYELTPPPPDFILSGTIKEKGTPVARTVRAYSRSTGQLFSTGASLPNGNFTLGAPDDTTEMFIIAFDDDPGEQYNPLIYGRVKAVPA